MNFDDSLEVPPQPATVELSGSHPQKLDPISEPDFEDLDNSTLNLRNDTPDEPNFPRSQSSTDATSLSGNPIDIENLQGKKDFLTLVWLDIVSLSLGTTSSFPLFFLKRLTASGQVLVLAQFSMVTATTVFVLLCHSKRYRSKVWIALILFESCLFYDILMSYVPTKALVEAEEDAELVGFYDSASYLQVFKMLTIFMNSFIVFVAVESQKGKRNILLFFGLIIFAIENLQEVTISKAGITSKLFKAASFCSVASITALAVIFVFNVFYYQKIDHSKLKLEVEENKKFKFMFNFIEDGVILLEGRAVRFMNSHALELFDLCKSLGEGDGEDSPVFDNQIFHVFLTPNEESLPCHASMALKDLSQIDPKTVMSGIFTTARAVAECTRMDEIHELIEQTNARFFSLRFIKVSKAQAQSEAVKMVQISDITVRVQGQYLRVEREYLSLINSTVSHEMRNPLNALVAQIHMQQTHLRNIKDHLLTCHLGCSHRTQQEKLISESEKSLGIALSSTKMLRFNVEDILALPQLKQGKFTKNVSVVDLRDVVNEVVNILSVQAHGKQIEVVQQFTDFADGPIRMDLDAQRFQQVVLNYLSNALKFTQRMGSVKIVVKLVSASEQESGRAYRRWREDLEAFWSEGKLKDSSFSSDLDSSEDDKDEDESDQNGALQEDKIRLLFKHEKGAPLLVLSVLDTGVGLKEQEQQRLFKMFGTIERTRAVNTRGIGLGLSISKMICEEFGGQVGLLSKLKTGSAFLGSFQIDKVKPSEAAQQYSTDLQNDIKVANQVQREAVLKTQSLIQTSGVNTAARSRILVVDDEAYNCEVLRAIISSLKIPNFDDRLVVCMNGREALRAYRASLLKSEPIGVILTDLSMPVMDGYQMMARIRKLCVKEKAQPPVIAALTGHTEAEFISQAFASGADQVYSKPISVEQVRQVLLQGGIEF